MSARITDAQRTAAVYAVHARLRRETIHGDSITSNAGQIAHIAVDALAAKGWTPPPTRRPAHGVAELAADGASAQGCRRRGAGIAPVPIR